ncbi:MAG: hypothetical protein IJ675_04110 [Pseudobutyrivibrio sp.]|nr:hypothetical protein [Pseudobutyrivibrio sp.]
MKTKITYISLLIGLLFFCNSTQYLSWFYNLSASSGPYFSDLFGQVLGELAQGIGILGFIFYRRLLHKREQVSEFASLVAMNYLLAVVCLLPPDENYHFYRFVDESILRRTICMVCSPCYFCVA